MLLLRVLLLAVCCSCLQSNCNKTVLDNIKRLWGEKAPRINLEKLVGRFTGVWGSPSYFDRDHLKCAQFILDKDAMTTRDYEVSKEGEVTGYRYDYYLIVEQPGVITSFSPDFNPEDFMYVIYLNYKHGVLAYYQCEPTAWYYKPFVGVAVLRYNKKNCATARAIQEAKAVLDKLGINGAPVPTDCESFTD